MGLGYAYIGMIVNITSMSSLRSLKPSLTGYTDNGYVPEGQYEVVGLSENDMAAILVEHKKNNDYKGKRYIVKLT